MIYITIHDDDFKGVLKDMTVKIDPQKYAGKNCFGLSRLRQVVVDGMAVLLRDWWRYRNRTEEEVYGETDEDLRKEKIA